MSNVVKLPDVTGLLRCLEGENKMSVGQNENQSFWAQAEAHAGFCNITARLALNSHREASGNETQTALPAANFMEDSFSMLS